MSVIASPRGDFRSTDEALQKRFSNLAIDLWNLSQQFIVKSKNSADSLETFLNSRYSGKTTYKQLDGHLFAAEDQIRAVDEINTALERQAEIIDKFRRSEGNFPALKSLASIEGVPELLRSRIMELSKIVPLIRVALDKDLEWRKEWAKRAPLSLDDESIALVVSWRDSTLLFMGLFDRLYALIV